MDDAQFKELTDRIDVILKLLALSVPAGATADRILKLRNAGLKISQIAEVIGTTEGYVNVALGRARKEKKKRKPEPK